jgi:hypothetical protein
MVYLNNPEIGGSDIKSFVVGDPGNSRKYDLLKGETWGFENNIADSIIRVFGVVDGDKHGLNKGFLKLVQPSEAGETKVTIDESIVEGKTIYTCSACGFNKENKLPVQGHVGNKHPGGVVHNESATTYKKQEGIKIVPPEEIDRLRKQRQETSSMRPRRSLMDLEPKGEEEVGYRNRRGVDINDNGLNTNAEMAKNFYGPGLQEDKI